MCIRDSKSTSIDPSVVDADGVYRKTGPARVFRAEKEVIAAIKSGGIKAGDVIVLMCRGPMAVSYTHLDVYKRQGRDYILDTNAKRPGRWICRPRPSNFEKGPDARWDYISRMSVSA